MDQRRCSRHLFDGRTIQLGPEEIAGRCVRNVHRIGNDAIAALVRAEDPGHIARLVLYRFRNLHEHGEDQAGPVEHPEGVGDAALIERNVDSFNPTLQ